MNVNLNNIKENPDKTISIGIDLGGTNTVIGVVNGNGEIISKTVIPSVTATVEEWADNVVKECNNLLRSVDEDCEIIGMGIGAPCANSVTGYIEAATDLPWKSPISLVKMFSERVNYPITITNDANAAAIGEMIYGVAKGLRNFIVLTLGTGVGSGIVCDGHLINGTRGFAGELGHVTFPFAKGRLCGCGREGCLQTVASAKGIMATTKKMLEESGKESLLREIPLEQINPKTVSEAANEGDHLAKEIFNFTGNCLGKAAAEFAAFSDPEAIILFGGVTNAGDLLLKPMKKAFRESSLHLYKDRVRILISTIPESEAAVLGAAALPFFTIKNN